MKLTQSALLIEQPVIPQSQFSPPPPKSQDPPLLLQEEAPVTASSTTTKKKKKTPLKLFEVTLCVGVVLIVCYS